MSIAQSYNQLTNLWFKNKQEFRDEVRDLLHQDTERKCARSYVHENGFAKITILEAEDKSSSLRIHIWRRDKEESNVHSHCFNLTSTVLTGKIRDRIYLEDSRGIEFKKFLYSRRGARERYSLTPLGISRLRTSEITDRGPGDRYTHKFDTLHTSQAISNELVTLFIADRRGAPETAFVYSNRYSIEGQQVESPAMDSNKIFEAIDSIC